MALVLADRVQETTNTTGTGTLTLAGAVSGFQSFSAIGNTNTTYYAITSGTDWEVGIGTYTSVGTTLSRDIVLSSSAAGAKITVAAGASVFATYPASIANPMNITGYTTTATAGGTTTLTVNSTFNQFFTGTTTQTVVLPVTSTLSLGWSFWITNNSTGNLTVNSSGGNAVFTVTPQTTAMFTCIDITVTTAAGWDSGIMEFGSATGTGSVVQATGPTISKLVLAAGTATAGTAPLKFTAGTNLTTAEAGAFEYDGTVPFFSMAASSRGVLHNEQVVILGTAYTLTSQTAAQKLFNATTNGAVTLPVGTYQFECAYSLTNLSATSGSFGFALAAGTAVIAAQGWSAYAIKPATLSTAGNASMTYNTAANTTLVAANTNTNGMAFIKGFVRITTAGTIIPQVSLGVAIAAIVGVNSYFKISPIANSGTAATNFTVGNWS